MMTSLLLAPHVIKKYSLWTWECGEYKSKGKAGAGAGIKRDTKREIGVDRKG